MKREPIPDKDHNLEDGDAVVRFGDGLSCEETRKLAFATADPEEPISAPRPSLERGEVVLSAWERFCASTK